jgi:hypothetical protein
MNIIDAQSLVAPAVSRGAALSRPTNTASRTDAPDRRWRLLRVLAGPASPSSFYRPRKSRHARRIGHESKAAQGCTNRRQ